MSLGIALIDFLKGIDLHLPQGQGALVVKVPLKDFFTVAGPGSPYMRPTRNPRSWSQGVSKMLHDQFGIEDYEVRLEAGETGDPKGPRAAGAVRALRALLEPNVPGDLANVSLEIGPVVDFLSPQPHGALRKLFRAIASGVITEAMLKEPSTAATA